MKQITENDLQTAENIGYKSKFSTIRYAAPLVSGICCLALCFSALIHSPHIFPAFGWLIIPALFLLGFVGYRVNLYRKAPKCLIKKNQTTLFFWHKRTWKSVSLSEIEKVYIATGRFTHRHGDMWVYTKDGKYVICDVEDFDEVKVRIGVYKKQ